MSEDHSFKSQNLNVSRFNQLFPYLKIVHLGPPVGKGVTVTRNFKVGETVLEFRGKIVTKQTMMEKSDPDNDHYLQITRDLYLGPTRTADSYVNHSCDPNLGIRIKDGRVLAVAVKDIPEGSLLTFDYSTTMAEDFWEMDCLCGSPNCRGRIRDFKYLPEDAQRRYLDLDVVPGFVIDSVKKPRRRGKVC